MDGSRFDDLAKTFAGRRSRRSVLRALAGAAGIGLAALGGGAGRAAGRCKTVGQTCKTSADCCPGTLGNGNVQCATTGGGKQKSCQSCPGDAPAACNGGCVALTTNGNCGGCGVICGGGTSCVDSACVCPSGRALCGGRCVDPTTDTSNCGTCGHVCPAPANGSATCAAGACGFACAGGYKTCNGGCIPSTDCCEPPACQANADCCGTNVCSRTSGTCVACLPEGETVGTHCVDVDCCGELICHPEFGYCHV